MAPFKYALSGLAMMASAVSAAGVGDDMGPAAFLWPPDRVWSGDMDNTAPCGSVASAGNRTKFPLVNGQVSLVAQDGSYHIELAVSHLDDPTSDTDFETLIDDDRLDKMDPGHACFFIPNAPQSARAGDGATLQIKYISDFDKPENQTFYACADIEYVEIAEFKERIVGCFNETIPDDGEQGPQDAPNHDDWDNDGTDDGNSSNSGNSGNSGSAPSDSADGGHNTSESGSKKLSGGAIAGIVVGSVAGVALLAGAGLFIYRRKQQRLTALRQKHSARGVDWNNAQAGKLSTSSNNSVRMETLP